MDETGEPGGSELRTGSRLGCLRCGTEVIVMAVDGPELRCCDEVLAVVFSPGGPPQA